MQLSWSRGPLPWGLEDRASRWHSMCVLSQAGSEHRTGAPRRLAADHAFSLFQGHHRQEWRNHPHVFGIHPRDRAPATPVPGKSPVGLAERAGIGGHPGCWEEHVAPDMGAGPQQTNDIWYELPHTHLPITHPAPCVTTHSTSVNVLLRLIFSHLWPDACSVSSSPLHHPHPQRTKSL